jgi:hypothetical protein
MTADLAASTPLRVLRPWALLFVPAALALAGVLVRYLAYVSVTAAPSPQGFADAMCVWDCYWYGDVALHGYQAHPEQLNFGGPAGIANWAFFPLYPMLIAAVGKLVSASPAALGGVVSPLLALGAVLASWPAFDGNRRAYYLFAALLLVGPFSFYFASLYSESLFLLLTVLAFVALARRRYVAAGIFGTLLSATRTVGVLFVFAILAEALIEFRARRLGPAAMLRELLRRPDIILGIFLVPLGLFAFMAWLHLATGDALAFAHIQRAWDREIVNPASALWFALTSPGGQTRDPVILAFAGIGGLLLCGALFWRRQIPAAVFCTLCLVLALTNGVESMLRFVAALAPLGIVLAQILSRWPWLSWLSFVVFVVLDFAWTISWIHQQGALM